MIKYTLEELKKLHDEYLLTEDDEHKDEHYDTDRGFAGYNAFLDFLSEREKTLPKPKRGRRPIGERAMTSSERSARRIKLFKERIAALQARVDAVFEEE